MFVCSACKTLLCLETLVKDFYGELMFRIVKPHAQCTLEPFVSLGAWRLSLPMLAGLTHFIQETTFSALPSLILGVKLTNFLFLRLQFITTPFPICDDFEKIRPLIIVIPLI